MYDSEHPTRKTLPAKCRSCNHPLDSPLFCGDCRTLHSAEDCNYFELLGLAQSYKLDPAELRRHYLNNSRNIHPDQHGEADTNLSLRASALLNEAYRVLVDPLLRAEYLLEEAGGQSAREDKNVPQDVLIRTLMLREEIEEARAARNEAALDGYRQQIQQLREQAFVRIAELAESLPGNKASRRELRSYLNTAKYYQKLLDQL
ncbi:MAG: Fe-S protein assembly co-chaperone HscB [Planctomycetota bacterium]